MPQSAHSGVEKTESKPPKPADFKAFHFLTNMTLILLIFSLLSPPTNAAPVLKTSIFANSATCAFSYKSEGHGAAEAFYQVHIGRPYINGGGCPSILSTLTNAATYVGEYACIDDGAGQTNLSFVTPTDAARNVKVVNALQASYPMVPFQAKRICFHGDVAPLGWPIVSIAVRDFEGEAQPDLVAAHSRMLGITEDNAAYPVPKLIEPRNTIAPGQSTCTGSSNTFVNINESAFSITIGRPYLNGVHRAAIEATLSSIFAFFDLTIKGAADDANTKMTIISNIDSENLANINLALQAVYPDIEFSCPTDLSTPMKRNG